MKLGGIGGNTTKTGLIFEKNTDLKKALISNRNFELKNKGIFYNDKYIGFIFIKNTFYTDVLEKNNINWKSITKSKILPDEGIFLKSKNKILIIEKKFQNVSGSVDEKLQTCDFKLKKYKKLCRSIDNTTVEYVYVLNNWFKKEKYSEVLKYIKEVGCDYYFNEIPIKILI